MSRDQIIAVIYRVADEYRIPRLLLLACCIAESNLRQYARRPANPADDARYWPDVSAGVAQQAVRYDPAYQGGKAFPGPAEIERVMQLQYDVERSARVAAANLAVKFHDGTETSDDENLARDLFEYNWPAGHERPYTPEHEANYRRGLREGRAILEGKTVADVTPILQRVIELGRAETGKPYSGPIVGQPDSWRYGTPGYDCSSFVSEMVRRATGDAIRLTAYTDAAYGQCEWVQTPQPGDIVFYSYPDASQPGVKFPHMGIWLSSTEVLDCRYSDNPSNGGVGVRPHVTPISAGSRYRQTMRPRGLAAVQVEQPAPSPGPDPRDAEIVSLKAQLDDARMKLGVASVNYANDLENLVNALRALNPAA